MGRPKSTATERKCKRCGTVKMLIEFPRNKYMPLGRAYQCRWCSVKTVLESGIRRRIRAKGFFSFKAEIEHEKEIIAIKERILGEIIYKERIKP
jgi:hypothetical protein